MIEVTPNIALDEDELDFKFIRASGPGGQNVNKVATAVQMRFDVRRSQNLPLDVAAKLEKLAGSRLTLEGEIVISADRFRTQERNKQDAIDRLCELIRKAATPVKRRRPTKPTKASKERRLAAKGVRSGVKRMRGKPVDGD